MYVVVVAALDISVHVIHVRVVRPCKQTSTWTALELSLHSLRRVSVSLSLEHLSRAQEATSSDTTEIACYAQNGRSRLQKVIRCCANRRSIYHFLLALNSNISSIFNHSGDIKPCLHFHSIPHSLPGRATKRQLGTGGHALL